MCAPVYTAKMERSKVEQPRGNTEAGFKHFEFRGGDETAKIKSSPRIEKAHFDAQRRAGVYCEKQNFSRPLYSRYTLGVIKTLLSCIEIGSLS